MIPSVTSAVPVSMARRRRRSAAATSNGCSGCKQVNEGVTAAAASTPHREAGWRALARTAMPFLVVGALWEAVARAGIFHPRLFPSLEAVAAQFARLMASGALPHHAADTLIRLGMGFALAAVAGIAIGIVM